MSKTDYNRSAVRKQTIAKLRLDLKKAEAEYLDTRLAISDKAVLYINKHATKDDLRALSIGCGNKKDAIEKAKLNLERYLRSSNSN